MSDLLWEENRRIGHPEGACGARTARALGG